MNTDSHFQSSDQLQALDSEIQATQDRLEQLKTERATAVADRAAGTEGAAQRLEDAHAESDRLTRQLEDARLARDHEAQRLAQLHAEAISAKQDERRQQVEAARQKVDKAAAKVDTAFDKALAALTELDTTTSKFAQIHANGAGRGTAREALQVLKARLAEFHGGSGDPGYRVASKTPGPNVVEAAYMPTELEAFGEG